MSRKPREFQSGFSYHITMRCNNREFRLNRYKKFCQQYRTKPKSQIKRSWGSKLLAGLGIARGSPKKRSRGQLGLPWDSWEAENAVILAVAIKFVGANALNPKIALMMLG